jgi:hypothetical protein
MKIVCRCFMYGRTGMHNMTRRSHQMQKHKFDVMCPSALFMEIALHRAHPSTKDSVSTFHTTEAPEYTR